MTPAQREAAIRRGMKAAQAGMLDLDEEGRQALIRLYEWAVKNIAQEITQRSEADGSVALYQLADLRRQVEARLAQLSAGQASMMSDGLSQASRLGVSSFAEAGIDAVAMVRVPDEAARFVRAFVAADGLQLSDRLWRIDRGARDAVVNAIERAVIMGDSAAKSAREFLTRGQPVPGNVQAKLNAANGTAIVRETTELMVGPKTGGGVMGQAMRVFRTEINRAHGVAYMTQAEQVPGFVGFRFTLSPQHPKPDICDELAKEDRFGLGEGVFPSMAEFLRVWPAHPNTFSFPIGVFGPA